MFSKIVYVICLADGKNKANIIHWSLIKCKQIICNFLIAKFYEMVYGFVIRAIIKTMLKKILGYAILLILYIDSKSLYNCFIVLGKTKEKQLIVVVISLY